jgi:hypothetical protein
VDGRRSRYPRNQSIGRILSLRTQQQQFEVGQTDDHRAVACELAPELKVEAGCQGVVTRP